MIRKLIHKIFVKIFAKENRLFIYLLFVLSFIAFLSVFANKWTSEQTVNTVSIIGNSIIPISEIYELVDTSSIGSETENVDLLSIKNRTLKHPYVSTSYVMKRNSKQIEIEVEEKEPSAILISPEGNIGYVDSDGKPLPYRLSMRFEELPIFQGLYKGNKLDSNSLSKALEINRHLNDERYSFIKEMTSEINFSSESNEFELITNDRAYEIKIGNTNSLSDKFELLKSIEKNIIRDIDLNNIDYVDLRWHKRVVLKLKKSKI